MLAVMGKKRTSGTGSEADAEGSTIRGTYLPNDLYEELDAYAAAEDRSTAFFVRRAVEKYLAELRKSGPPGPSQRKGRRKKG